MQISRRVLLACAAAAMIPLTLPAAETADQAKSLEEALHQKMNQVQSQPAAQPQAPARPAPKAPPPEKETPKQPQTTAAASAPGFGSAPEMNGTNANTRALEEALHQKMSEASPSATTSPARPAPVAAAPTRMTSPEEAPEFQWVANAPTPFSPEEMDKLQEALDQKMAELNAQPRPPERETRPALSEAPLAAPPLPITSSKAVKLQALLQNYIANRISPEQYHVERAKILGEP